MKDRRKFYFKEPVKAIDISKSTTAAGIVDQFANTAFQARTLNQVARVWENAIKDSERPVIFLCLSASLIACGLREAIRKIIENGWCDVVVTTGGLPYQDVYQARGNKHWIGSPVVNDEELCELEIDRIYDTFVDEREYKNTDKWFAETTGRLPPKFYGSRELFAYWGKALSELPSADKSFVATAHRVGVPILSPALNDSSIGIGLARLQALGWKGGVDSLKDNLDVANIKKQKDYTAVIYIGGGVPKNFIEQLAIQCELLPDSDGKDIEGHSYSAQITTDIPQHGGLSGCTPDEAIAWGKNRKDCRRAMCHVDASIGLPLVLAYLTANCEARKPIAFKLDTTA